MSTKTRRFLSCSDVSNLGFYIITTPIAHTFPKRKKERERDQMILMHEILEREVTINQQVLELANSLSVADAWLGDEFERSAELFQHAMDNESYSLEERAAVLAGAWVGVNSDSSRKGDTAQRRFSKMIVKYTQQVLLAGDRTVDGQHEGGILVTRFCQERINKPAV